MNKFNHGIKIIILTPSQQRNQHLNQIFFVGVLTDTKIKSASKTAFTTSIVKNKCFPRCSKTILSRSGSEFQAPYLNQQL
jgi:hypothetical protein